MTTRKIRIVCISDTHNQTPKLPPGDVLIHAGDLTNQGSYSELKKTIEWLEKANFEAKIVIAGNHDITLDEPFFSSNENKWKWPHPQDPVACKNLLAESPSIIYLEHEAATITLKSTKGPRTRFKIFGSPYSPGRRGWAFQYPDNAAADRLWSTINDDVDILVTHTPPYGHCDAAENVEDSRIGCSVLLERLGQIRPLLHVCGHIHQARGAERIRWHPSPSISASSGDRTNPYPVDSVNTWKDPGAGNKKLSLLDLTARLGNQLGWQQTSNSSQTETVGQQYANENGIQHQRALSGTIKSNLGPSLLERAAETRNGRSGPNETVVINAAILGPRIMSKASPANKPIVVDIELPVWPDNEM